MPTPGGHGIGPELVSDVSVGLHRNVDKFIQCAKSAQDSIGVEEGRKEGRRKGEAGLPGMSGEKWSGCGPRDM